MLAGRSRLISSSILQKAGPWGLHEFIEYRGPVDQKSKAEDLKPLESLPAKTQTYDPDEERAARVDGAARGGTDDPSHR